MRKMTKLLAAFAVATGLALGPVATCSALADTPFKIGVIVPLSGPFQSIGREIDQGIKLYLSQHPEAVAGRTFEIVMRDDAGVPDTTRRVAQEMVVKDKVNVLFGFALTPLALAAAPVATQAKIPEIVTSAATSTITAQSPYIVRIAQVTPTLGMVPAQWALKNGVKRVVTVVSDYGPGYDVEKWFSDTFKKGGGEIIENLRVPLANPDFSPFLQRVADAKPDVMFAFVPAGVGSIFVKQFVERGLDKSGIRFMATADVMDDDILNAMGDVVQGVTTAGPYSAALDNPQNKAFVAAFQKANPANRPNFIAVFAYDGMQMLANAIQKTKGDSDGTALVEAMKGMQLNSPRGPVTIDPATRDVVQNLYMFKVQRVNGQLYNVPFEVIPSVKDPAK